MRYITALFVLTMFSAAVASAQGGLPPAMPEDPIDAIVEALATYRVIGLGEGAHRGEQDQVFRLALIRDARVKQRAQDIVTECGNSRYQDVMDRYIRGEEVPYALLRRTWEDSIVATTICDSSVYKDFFAAVREVNAGSRPEQQWRILLGSPPLEWDRVKTFNDIANAEAGRDAFAADLIRREVLAKGRRALVMFGRIHMLLRNERDNYESGNWLVAQLEEQGEPVFKIWTAVGGLDLGSIQEDIRSVPTLARIRGSRLGAADLMSYFASDGRLTMRDGRVTPVPREQWRSMPMERLVDAVLYLGPTATYARIPTELCDDQAYLDMRIKRLSLMPDGESEIDRLKQNCSARR
jgi:hypothetical protein